MKALKDRTGCYGRAKFKAFAVLEGRGWVTSRELIILAGLPYHSISKLLPRWVHWEYVQREMTFVFGAGTWKYKLTARGEGWLKAARASLPMAATFAEELRSWQHSIQDRIPALLSGKFIDVVKILS